MDLALVMKIEELIRATYVESGTVIYWPEQFMNELRISQEDVLRALKILVQQEKLLDVVQVLCTDNHIVWQGTPEELPAALSAIRLCDECGNGTRIDVSEQTFMHFRLSPAWKKVLDEASSSEKKSPRLSRH